MCYEESHNMIFSIYDLRRVNEKYELYPTRVESSTIDGLFSAFRNSLVVPPKQAFVEKLQSLITSDASAGLELNIG